MNKGCKEDCSGWNAWVVSCNTNYTWNGSSCVAVSNGVCGTADKTVVGSIPSGVSACNPGTRSPVTTATSNYTWTCAGTNGGTTSSTCTACRTGYTWDGNNCVAEEVGICNTINIQVGVTNLDTLSDSAFCKKGVPLKNWSSSWFIWAKTATWKCRLSGGQDSDLCSVTCPAGSELNQGICRDAKCGTTPLSCALGTLGLDFSTDDDYEWSCMGASGSEQRCQLQRNLVNGKCSTTLAYECDKGTVMNRDTLYSSYIWDCEGENGGTTASCQLQGYGGGDESLGWSCDDSAFYSRLRYEERLGCIENYNASHFSPSGRPSYVGQIVSGNSCASGDFYRNCTYFEYSVSFCENVVCTGI